MVAAASGKTLLASVSRTAVNSHPKSPCSLFSQLGRNHSTGQNGFLFGTLSHGDHDDGHHNHEPVPKSHSSASVQFTAQSTANFNRRTKTAFGQQRFFSTSSISNSPASPQTTQVPDFSKYKNSGDGRSTYYMLLGTTGFVGAVSAKNFVVDFIQQLAPGADVLALAKAELDLAAIPEGKNVTIKWRGKPVFIRHRTQAEIAEANSVSISELRDPQTDADRVKQPEWLVVLGICTHLGCVPIGEAGDYDGWYCPCHGSHYDISGRIRKGPAPLNLEVPPYEIVEGQRLIIG